MNAIEELLEKYYDTLGAMKQICLALDNTKKALYCDEERETVTKALAEARKVCEWKRSIKQKCFFTDCQCVVGRENVREKLYELYCYNCGKWIKETPHD